MPSTELIHRELTDRIIGVFYDVHNDLTGGYLEQIYKRAMVIALTDAGLTVDHEVPATVWFRNQRIGDFRLDMVVNQRVVLELKTAEKIVTSHRSQLLNYLKSSKLQVGLVLNFGTSATFSRVVNELPRRRTS